MGFEENVIEVCKAIAEKISKLKIFEGMKPSTIACVTILMILQRSPKYSAIFDCVEIGKSLGIKDDAAIRKLFRKIDDLENDILPIGFLQKIITEQKEIRYY